LQSAGALICKKWIVRLEERLVERGLTHGWDGDFAYLAWVHDEVQVACRTKEIAEIVVTEAQAAMRDAQAFFKFRTQLDTEGKVGLNWAECH
jgi:DNA polymerase-1